LDSSGDVFDQPKWVRLIIMPQGEVCRAAWRRGISEKWRVQAEPTGVEKRG
jgi:hypothetical protein